MYTMALFYTSRLFFVFIQTSIGVQIDYSQFTFYSNSRSQHTNARHKKKKCLKQQQQPKPKINTLSTFILFDLDLRLVCIYECACTFIFIFISHSSLPSFLPLGQKLIFPFMSMHWQTTATTTTTTYAVYAHGSRDWKTGWSKGIPILNFGKNPPYFRWFFFLKCLVNCVHSLLLSFRRRKKRAPNFQIKSFSTLITWNIVAMLCVHVCACNKHTLLAAMPHVCFTCACVFARAQCALHTIDRLPLRLRLCVISQFLLHTCVCERFD